MPELKLETRAWDDNSYAITFNTKTPVLWLWVSLKGIESRCDDNFICIEPDRPMRIRVIPAKRLKLEEFREVLQVRSLWDTWQEPAVTPEAAPAAPNRVALLAQRMAAIEAAAKKSGKKRDVRKNSVR